MDGVSQGKKYDVELIDIKKTEWIDVNCKNNKKLYDVNGNVIVIGKPSPKIHTMATYDMSGNLIEDAPSFSNLFSSINCNSKLFVFVHQNGPWYVH